MIIVGVGSDRVGTGMRETVVVGGEGTGVLGVAEAGAGPPCRGGKGARSGERELSSGTERRRRGSEMSGGSFPFHLLRYST